MDGDDVHQDGAVQDFFWGFRKLKFSLEKLEDENKLPGCRTMQTDQKWSKIVQFYALDK